MAGPKKVAPLFTTLDKSQLTLLIASLLIATQASQAGCQLHACAGIG